MVSTLALMVLKAIFSFLAQYGTSPPAKGIERFRRRRWPVFGLKRTASTSLAGRDIPADRKIPFIKSFNRGAFLLLAIDRKHIVGP
jgi:hypothetical protein